MANSNGFQFADYILLPVVRVDTIFICLLYGPKSIYGMAMCVELLLRANRIVLFEQRARVQVLFYIYTISRYIAECMQKSNTTGKEQTLLHSIDFAKAHNGVYGACVCVWEDTFYSRSSCL